MRKQPKSSNDTVDRWEKFFKIGVSHDYILIRQDFPITELSPSEFSALLKKLFDQNEGLFDEK